MKVKNFFILLALLVAVSSCTTQRNVAYFQDITEDGAIVSQAEKFLVFRKGDKITVNVNSAATPEQAARYMTPLVSTRGSGLSASQYQSPYTVDNEGNITMPGLPPVKAEGLTRSQLESTIQSLLRADLLKDAVVTVDVFGRYVTVLGEVRVPGRIEMTKDYLTILEALGAVGDLNIQAMRNEIVVLRHEDGQIKNYFVDMRSKDIMNSPVFYLQQDDVIYVKPNKYRRGQSTVNDNSLRSISTWLSVASVVTSITILITNAVR